MRQAMSLSDTENEKWDICMYILVHTYRWVEEADFLYDSKLRKDNGVTFSRNRNTFINATFILWIATC